MQFFIFIGITAAFTRAEYRVAVQRLVRLCLNFVSY